MADPPNMMNADIEQNVTAKMDKYISETPQRRFKINVFTDNETARSWSKLDHSIVHTDIPLIPVPAGFNLERTDEFNRQLQQFTTLYFRERGLNPKCHCVAMEDEPASPKIHFLIYNRNVWYIDFKTRFPYTVIVKPPLLPKPGDDVVKPPPVPPRPANLPPPPEPPTSDQETPESSSSPKPSSMKSFPPSSTSTFTSGSSAVSYNLDTIFEESESTESTWTWSTRVELMSSDDLSDDLSDIVEDLPEDDPPPAKKNKEEEL